MLVCCRITGKLGERERERFSSVSPTTYLFDEVVGAVLPHRRGHESEEEQGHRVINLNSTKTTQQQNHHHHHQQEQEQVNHPHLPSTNTGSSSQRNDRQAVRTTATRCAYFHSTRQLPYHRSSGWGLSASQRPSYLVKKARQPYLPKEETVVVSELPGCGVIPTLIMVSHVLMPIREM